MTGAKFPPDVETRPHNQVILKISYELLLLV